jgi:hypothetical protein
MEEIAKLVCQVYIRKSLTNINGTYIRDPRELFCATHFLDHILFFEKYSTNADTHTRISIHPYEHTHVHPTPMSTSERLSQFDLEIHEVGHKYRLAVNRNVTFY